MSARNLRVALPWVVAIAMTAAMVAPMIAAAQGFQTIVPCSGAIAANNEQPCTICSLAQLAQNILNDLIYLAVVISAVLFARGGWMYLTAGGDTGKATGSRKILTNVFIGLIIILAAWLIVDTLMKTLVGSNSSFGPWNAVCTTSAGG